MSLLLAESSLTQGDVPRGFWMSSRCRACASATSLGRCSSISISSVVSTRSAKPGQCTSSPVYISSSQSSIRNRALYSQGGPSCSFSMAFYESRPDNTPPYLGNSFPDPAPQSLAEPGPFSITPDSGRYLPGSGTQSSRMTGLTYILPDLGKDSPGPGSMSAEKSGNLIVSTSSGLGGPGPEVIPTTETGGSDTLARPP